jgi:hypothetical protein
MDVLHFEEGGRTFTCKAESSVNTPGVLWWWVRVSGDDTRYAAFHCAPGDTARTLQTRVIAYYEQVLAIRARPMIVRKAWSRPPPAEIAAKPAENGAAAVAVASGTPE